MLKRRIPKYPIIFIIAALGALSLNVLGSLVDPALDEPLLKGKSTLVPGYHYAVKERDELRALLQSPAASVTNFDLKSVNTLVFLSIRHSDKRKVTIFENWWLWVMGHFYEPLSRTQNTERLIAGRGALCGQSAQVLKSIVEKVGLFSRFIGLEGHVVLEVKMPEGWRVADPDYGLTFPAALEKLHTKAGIPLLMEALTQKGYRDDIVRKYTSYFQSHENNTVLEIASPLSPRLYKIERISEWLKWIFPIVVLCAGLTRAFRQTDKPRSSPKKVLSRIVHLRDILLL
ncbi:MAG: hypothetical protein GY801_43690 [bacterium]|nr:hypothetical protein [bacterium]